MVFFEGKTVEEFSTALQSFRLKVRTVSTESRNTYKREGEEREVRGGEGWSPIQRLLQKEDNQALTKMSLS